MVTGTVARRDVPHESCACTSGVYEPQSDGVPAMAPENASIETPEGSTPETTDHVGVPIAPLTVGVIRNGAPTWATGAGGIVSVNAGASMVSESVTLARLVGQVGS